MTFKEEKLGEILKIFFSLKRRSRLHLEELLLITVTGDVDKCALPPNRRVRVRLAWAAQDERTTRRQAGGQAGDVPGFSPQPETL